MGSRWRGGPAIYKGAMTDLRHPKPAFAGTQPMQKGASAQLTRAAAPGRQVVSPRRTAIALNTLEVFLRGWALTQSLGRGQAVGIEEMAIGHSREDIVRLLAR
jgi:hypothetical protein